MTFPYCKFFEFSIFTRPLSPFGDKNAIKSEWIRSQKRKSLVIFFEIPGDIPVLNYLTADYFHSFFLTVWISAMSIWDLYADLLSLGRAHCILSSLKCLVITFWSWITGSAIFRSRCFRTGRSSFLPARFRKFQRAGKPATDPRSNQIDRKF